MKVASLTLAALLISTVPSVAQRFPSCAPEAKWTELFDNAASQIPGAKVTKLDQKETAAYLDVLNSTPPVTHISADHLLILTGPPRPVLIAFVTGDIACVIPANSTVHEKALTAAKGQPS